MAVHFNGQIFKTSRTEELRKLEGADRYWNHFKDTSDLYYITSYDYSSVEASWASNFRDLDSVSKFVNYLIYNEWPKNWVVGRFPNALYHGELKIFDLNQEMVCAIDLNAVRHFDLNIVSRLPTPYAIAGTNPLRTIIDCNHRGPSKILRTEEFEQYSSLFGDYHILQWSSADNFFRARRGEMAFKEGAAEEALGALLSSKTLFEEFYEHKMQVREQLLDNWIYCANLRSEHRRYTPI